MSYSRESGDKGHTTKTRRAPNKLARVRVVRDGTRGDLAGRDGIGREHNPEKTIYSFILEAKFLLGASMEISELLMA